MYSTVPGVCLWKVHVYMYVCHVCMYIHVCMYDVCMMYVKVGMKPWRLEGLFSGGE